MPKGEQRFREVKKRAFARDIASGKHKIQAYKDNVATKDISDKVASVNSSRLLKDAIVTEEIKAQVARITPESVLARIDNLAQNGKPADSVKLRALELLGNTQRASIFKEAHPVATYNTLNVLDLDELRRKLAETSTNPGNQLSTGTTYSTSAQ